MFILDSNTAANCKNKTKKINSMTNTKTWLMILIIGFIIILVIYNLDFYFSLSFVLIIHH